jgi:DeoR/GlpR family transcriptional regulator of sugar metabolism
MAFLGVGAVDVKDGLTVYALEDVRVKRTILENSRRNIVLADGSKFAHTALISYGPIAAVDSIITDKSAPAEAVEAINLKGTRVIVAD